MGPGECVPTLKRGLGLHCAEAHVGCDCPLGQRCPAPTLQGGFTLVELMVALTLAGLVVLTAHRLFAAAGDAGRTLRAARAALDRQSNARRWLAATFLSLDVGSDSAGSFEGRSDHVIFSAWELTPDGWFERRRVSLGQAGQHLVAQVLPGESVVLADSITSLDIDYLLEPGAESRWVREWVSPVSAPLAVRMRIAWAGCGNRGVGCAVDTLLFLIKERG
jgi:prepilin-type N-terminal cleavage/methylation domain-containing protein